MKKPQGFTLIEMMVAISIAAILGAATIASYKSYTNQQTLNNVALDIKTQIESAKTFSSAQVKVSSVGSSCTNLNILTEYIFLVCKNSTDCSPYPGYQTQSVCGGIPQIYNNLAKQLPSAIVYDTTNTTCSKIEFLTPSGIVHIWNSAGSPVAACTIAVKTPGGSPIIMTVDSGGNVSSGSF